MLAAMLIAMGAGCAVPLGAEMRQEADAAAQTRANTTAASDRGVQQAGYAQAVGEHADGEVQLASVVTDNPVSKSISSALSDAAEGIGNVLTPEERVERAPDATSLDDQTAEPSAKLYVSFAHLYENSNKVSEAEHQYQRALKLDPTYLDALLGYGRLQERLGKQTDATSLYQAAVRAHPNEPSAYNHLGLCYARRHMLQEAKQAFERAIQLRPKNPGLRNHIAIVLVEMGRINEAFAHLRVVHGDAVAHYNIGCALHKKGDSRSAAQHFAAALQQDPNFVQARQWLQWLGAQPAGPQGLGHYASQRQPSSSPRQANPYGPSSPGAPSIRPLPPTGSSPPSRGMSEPAPLPPLNSSSVAPPNGPANAPQGTPGQADPGEDDLPVAPMPPGAPPPVIEPLPPLNAAGG